MYWAFSENTIITNKDMPEPEHHLLFAESLPSQLLNLLPLVKFSKVLVSTTFIHSFFVIRYTPISQGLFTDIKSCPAQDFLISVI